MPTFPPDDTTADNPFYIADVTKKSWGVYGTLENEPIWFSLDGVKGEEMTIEGKYKEDERERRKIKGNERRIKKWKEQK